MPGKPYTKWDYMKKSDSSGKKGGPKGKGRAEGKFNKSMTKGYIEEKQRQYGEQMDGASRGRSSKSKDARMEALMKKLKQLESMKGSAPAYKESGK